MPKTAGPILEVGSKDYGSTTSFRDAFVENEYIGVDLSAGKNVDRVVDLAAGIGDLGEAHFALAICCSVLEHVRRPWEMAVNLTRLIRPGGTIYVAVPWVIAELFPRIAWTRVAYSTNVPDEFFEVSGDGAGFDNGLAKYVNTPAGQRKYLPYLQVHMLGVRS